MESFLGKILITVFGISSAIAPTTSIMPQQIEDWSKIGVMQCELTHAQTAWRYSLEFHESKAKESALNPKDKDGTPSYSYFQFKPDTVKLYGVKYKMIPENLSEKEYIELTKNLEFITEVVTRMICDKDVVWKNEFPDVTQRFIGYPPKY